MCALDSEPAPVFDGLPGIVEGQEPLLVQAFLAELAVERFRCSRSPWATGRLPIQRAFAIAEWQAVIWVCGPSVPNPEIAIRNWVSPKQVTHFSERRWFSALTKYWGLGDQIRFCAAGACVSQPRVGQNAKKRAIVAVARKLAVLLHRLWVTQQPYDPLHGALPAAS